MSLEKTVIPPSAYVHVAGALLFFGGMIAAPALAARRVGSLGAEIRWRQYSNATALIVTVASVASLADASTGGLVQRIAIVAGLAWVAALAQRCSVHRLVAS